MKPMLAKSFKPDWIKGLPYFYIQPKFDGQRAIWTGQQLLSRTGKLINSVDHITDFLNKHFAGFPLDGELYLHGKTLQEIISDTRKTVNVVENDMEYHIYDVPGTGTFEERFVRNPHLENIKFPLIRVPTLRKVAFGDIECFSLQGYEGTMIRNPYGLYKFGKRSSDLLKLKEFQDDEFKIVGITELSHKEKVIVPKGTPGSKEYADGTWYKDGTEIPGGTMGKLHCVTADGKEFGVGSGYDDALREEFWKNPPIGKVATVKYQKLMLLF